MDGDRPQVREEPEPAAELEQGLLRADGGIRVVPLRAADRAEQDRIDLPARGEVLVTERHAVRVDGAAADEVLGPGDLEPERDARGVEDAARLRHDLRPDPVAGECRDPVGGGRRHGSPSSMRGATNATDTPLISAPWSLLTATRYASIEASMMLVDKPWPVTTSAPGPSSDERRHRTSTCPWASSPLDTALISYSARAGCQLRTGWRASSTAWNSALTGPLPVASVVRSRPSTISVTVPDGVAAVRRGDAPPDELHGRRHFRGALLHERSQVRVGDLLLRVGQGDRLAVDLVERLAFDLVAEVLELLLEAAPPGQLADRQLAARQPDRLRGHDLVGQRVLDHAVLVDPGLVGERVAADDRLVRLDREPGQVADQAAGRRDLLGLDARAGLPELRRPRPEGHDDLFERRVAGPLAEAVDRHLDLAGAGLDRGERVGRGKPEVVVAVDADGGVIPDELDDPAHERGELGRDRVADRIRDVDRGRTGLDDRAVDLEQEVGVGPRGVLRGELDLGVAPELLATVGHPADRVGQRLLAIDAQLVLEVDVARGDEHVEVGPLGDLDRLDGPLRVAVAAAGERRHRDPALRLLGDPAHGFEVAG